MKKIFKNQFKMSYAVSRFFTRVAAMVFSMVIMITTPPNAHSEIFSDAYNQFDRWITNFDPVGKALEPLNEMPRLKVNGIISNSTFLNLHGDEQVGYVDKSWRFQEMQSLVALNTRLQLTPEAEFVNSFQFLYDGVYDWQKSSLYANKVNKDSYISHKGDQIIGDFHLDMELGDWYLKLGKQSVVWGKMEGRFMDFVNNLNSKDGMEVRASNYNQIRIPLWMANATYTFEESSLQFLWIPDFEPELSPFPGSVWWMPTRPDPILNPLYRGSAPEPNHSFNNHQWALKFDTQLGPSTTWSLGYMYGFAPSETNFVKRDDNNNLFFDAQYTRRHFVGSSFDYGYLITGVPIIKYLPASIRAEVVYKTDNYFTDMAKFDPIKKVLIADEGVTSTDSLDAAVQFNFYLPGKIWIFYEPIFSTYFGWRGSLPVNRWSSTHVIFMSKTWKATDDRLSTVYYLFFRTGGPLNSWDGMKNQFLLTYSFSDYLQLSLIYSNYSGGDNDLYGQYRKWDNIGWELKYTF